MTVGRPTAAHRRGEDAVVDFEIWHRRSLANDGVIDGREALACLPIAEQLVRLMREIAPTMAHIATCVGGEHGMFSPKAIRGWQEAQRRYPDNVVPFARNEFDPEVA